MSEDWLELTLERAERALARRGVRKFEIAVDEVSSCGVEVQDGEVQVVEHAHERGVGIRVLEGGLGFAGLGEPTDDELDAAVEAAVAEARRTRPAAIEDFAGNTGRGRTWGPDFADPRATGEARPRLETLALELEAATLAIDPRIQRVRPARIEEQRGRSAMRTSAGADVRDVFTRAFAMAGAVAEEGDEAASAYGSDSAGSVEALDLVLVSRAAGLDAAKLLGARPFRTARVPVVFGFDATAELLGAWVGALEADRIERGASFVRPTLGERVLSPSLTIIDDPHDADLDGAAWFDGEAVPTRPATIVENGALRLVLDDRDTAARAGREPSAHAVRSSAHGRPSAGVHNLAVRAGGSDLGALLRAAEGGIFVHALSGTHTMNDVTGELSLGVSGWAVRAGALAEAVDGVTIAGTLPTMLSGSVHLSSELRRVGSFRVPVMLVECVQVSSGGTGG